jgi:outer membrane protein assembly factor BamB
MHQQAPDRGPVQRLVELPGVASSVQALPGAGNWPGWRGPSGDGRAEGPAPRRWQSADFEWECPVEGRGHASPIVYGERVFVATATEEDNPEQRLLAIDRTTGQRRWGITVHAGGLPKIHPKNSHASATPACDGSRVFVAFVNRGALLVTAVSLEGKVLWQRDAGAFKADHGYGSSPVLYEGLVIVQADSSAGSFLAGLDRQTGVVVWRAARPAGNSYATPAVARLAGRPQLIAAGLGIVSSYDPASGRSLWTCRGPADTLANTVACADDLVLCSGGFPQKEILCIRADGLGDVTDTHVLWRTGRGVAYVPSPIYHEGHWYVLNDTGTLQCLEARTGKEVWKNHLPGTFFASPVLAGGALYLVSEEGQAYFVKAGPNFECRARNDTAEGCLATPAICGGRIYLRTHNRLVCRGGALPQCLSDKGGPNP